MALESGIITLPAEYACYYINGDASGLDDIEEANADRLADALAADGWYIVSVAEDESGNPQEAYFSNNYSFHGGLAKAGDVLDYVMHRQVA